MENIQTEPSSVENKIESIAPVAVASYKPQDLQGYTGKAPWPLLIVAGFMLLSGVGNIIYGLGRLSVFGLGVISIVIGGLLIWFAIAIFEMQKRGYKGGLILMGLGAASNIYQLIVPGGKLGWELACVAITLLPIVLLYLYRNKMVH